MPIDIDNAQVHFKMARKGKRFAGKEYLKIAVKFSILCYWYFVSILTIKIKPV
jgi:hypothetical protein